MEYTGGINLFTAHFVIGCKESEKRFTKTETPEIAAFHDWIDFKTNDWGMAKYRPERTQYVCFLRIIDLEDFSEILKDYAKIYKEKFPYATKDDFIEHTFSQTIHDLEKIISREYTWIGGTPTNHEYSYYYYFDNKMQEFLDFAIPEEDEIEHYIQYYKRVLRIISDFDYDKFVPNQNLLDNDTNRNKEPDLFVESHVNTVYKAIINFANEKEGTPIEGGYLLMMRIWFFLNSESATFNGKEIPKSARSLKVNEGKVFKVNVDQLSKFHSAEIDCDGIKDGINLTEIDFIEEISDWIINLLNQNKINGAHKKRKFHEFLKFLEQKRNESLGSNNGDQQKIDDTIESKEDEANFISYLKHSQPEKVAKICLELFSKNKSCAIMVCVLSKLELIEIAKTQRKQLFIAWYKYANLKLPKGNNFWGVNKFLDLGNEAYLFNDRTDVQFSQLETKFQKELQKISFS